MGLVFSGKESRSSGFGNECWGGKPRQRGFGHERTGKEPRRFRWGNGFKRAKKLADVQELIRVMELTEDVGDRLHPEVRPEYHRLWSALNPRS
ncbi:MAG: hypothetical protein GDA48_04305 [Hormoscilla sp. GM102CHS1]|nr:hypothetical protein [Hormoscilla sp. GM102CHS1]